ncbi:hypothetical protein KZP23_21335 [Echinicola marina]|uniref:hypothetical protein n=1 Tax=Echinicola marina TaxID=2859768 RepID=UPI001CF63C09|nr:hypothetical protein [Echinicola marina]UCS93165.1 hypothetical protein KZP23_21335 [Echinicola marina]
MEQNHAIQDEFHHLLVKVFKSEPSVALEELAAFEDRNSGGPDFEGIRAVFYSTKAKIHEDIGDFPKAMSIYHELLEESINKTPRDDYEIGVNSLSLVRLLERIEAINKAVDLAELTLKRYDIGLNCSLSLLNFLTAHLNESQLKIYQGTLKKINDTLGASIKNGTRLSDSIRKLFQENKRAAQKLTQLQASISDPITKEYIEEIQEYVDREPLTYYKEQGQRFLDYLLQIGK